MRRRIACVVVTSRLVVWALLCVPAAAAAPGSEPTSSDWPQWRGPRRDGISAESDWLCSWAAAGPKVLWKVEGKIGEGFSGPAIVGERLYTMGFLRDKAAKSPGRGRYAGHDVVWCLDARSGKVIWQYAYPGEKGSYYGPFGTPCVDEGRVYTLGKFGQLLCLDAATGKLIWGKDITVTFKTKKPYYGWSCMPAVAEGLVIVNVGHPGPAMAALDKKTGRVVWKAGKGPAGYSSPVAYRIGGKTAVTILTPAAALGLDARTGRELWSHPWKAGPQSSATTPLVAGTKVFVSASERKQWCALLDVSGQAAKVVWEHDQMNNYFNPPVLWEGHLYGIHSTDHHAKNAYLRCVEFETGKVKWSQHGVGKGGAIVAGGRLIVLCETGELLVAETNPGKYVERARAKVLKGTCWSPPVLCRGRIYCRDHRGTVVCLDVRP